MASGLFAGLVNQGLPSLFSLFLTPESVGNAEMTLGGIDSSKFTGKFRCTQLLPDQWFTMYTGSLTFASVTDQESGAWQLISPSISVNGKTSSALKKSRTFIFDSGTSNLVMPQADAEVSDTSAQTQPSAKFFAIRRSMPSFPPISSRSAARPVPSEFLALRFPHFPPTLISLLLHNQENSLT